MGKFFLRATGGVGLCVTADDEARYLPPDAAAAAAFDEAANPTHVTDFQANPTRYTFVAGVLQKDGVPAVFAADLPASLLRRAALVGVTYTKQDRATSGTAFVDVPETSLPLDPNTAYEAIYEGWYTAAAATTGVQLAVNGPASPAFLVAEFEVPQAAGSVVPPVRSTAYDSGVNGTASAGATPLKFRVRVVIKTGAAGGSLVLRGRSEVAGSAVTLLAGVTGWLTKAG